LGALPRKSRGGGPSSTRGVQREKVRERRRGWGKKAEIGRAIIGD